MKQKLFYQSIAILLFLLTVNWLANTYSFQWDLTEEKRYSITPATKQTLQNMEGNMEVFVFLQDDNLPAAFKRLQNETKTLLRQFERESRGKLQFVFENPIKNLSPEDKEQSLLELQERGITATNVRVKTKNGFTENIIFPGALINYGDKQFPVQLLSGQRGQEDLNQSIELLEYRFINAITKLQNENIPTVGFSTGHEELNKDEVLELQKSLGQNLIRSSFVDIQKTPPTADQLDVLVIAKPKTAFSESEKYNIDQYLMNGGKLLFAIDAMKMELDSLKSVWGGRNVAVDYKLNLDDLLFKYGVRLNRNLIRDLQSKPIPIVIDENGQSQLFPWTFYPVVSSNNNHIINQNIDPVSFEFASGIDTLNVPTLNTSVLLSSSQNTGLVANPVLVDLEELRTPPPASAFNLQNIPLAILVEGEFSSLFQHRAKIGNTPLPRKDKSEPTAIVVIADGDVLKNNVLPNGQTLPLGFDRNLGEQFGNQEFLLNTIDYLINPEHPLEARNKQYQIRLLNQTKAEQEKSKWQFVAIAAPVTLLILFGILFTWWRKRRWA